MRSTRIGQTQQSLKTMWRRLRRQYHTMSRSGLLSRRYLQQLPACHPFCIIPLIVQYCDVAPLITVAGATEGDSRVMFADCLIWVCTLFSQEVCWKYFKAADQFEASLSFIAFVHNLMRTSTPPCKLQYLTWSNPNAVHRTDANATGCRQLDISVIGLTVVQQVVDDLPLHVHECL